MKLKAILLIYERALEFVPATNQYCTKKLKQ